MKYLKYIDESMKDEEICEKAVINDGLNLSYVPKKLRSEKIYKIAFLQNASCVSLIPSDILKKIISELIYSIDNNPVNSKLLLLSELKPGDTISNAYSSIMKHDSWYSSLLRRYSGDNRKTTLQWIKDVFEESKKYMINKKLFRECIQNLSNLKITYQDDKDIIDEINTIQENYLAL